MEAQRKVCFRYYFMRHIVRIYNPEASQIMDRRLQHVPAQSSEAVDHRRSSR